MKNKYFIRSRISEKKFRQIIKLFSLDLTALQIASLTQVNRNTINSILKKLREKIAQNCDQSYFDKSKGELDEIYVGEKHIHGKKDKKIKEKVTVFGFKKRSGEIYTQVIKNHSKETLLPLIKEKLSQLSTVYTDGFKSYDNLLSLARKKLYKAYRSNKGFALEIGAGNSVTNHVNGIKIFLSIAKVRLLKFRGINKNTFYLHLKECEFRFNNRSKDLYKLLLDVLRKEPLN